jgi:hypothetical protein
MHLKRKLHNILVWCGAAHLAHLFAIVMMIVERNFYFDNGYDATEKTHNENE